MWEKIMSKFTRERDQIESRIMMFIFPEPLMGWGID